MKWILTLVYIFVTFSIEGQVNLVIDSSFEQYNYIPDGSLNFVNIQKVLPLWIAPTDGTPDYFHLNATNLENTIPFNGYKSKLGIPGCTGYQYPKSGNGMVGFGCRKDIKDTFTLNEYLQTKFSSALIKNHQYYVSFYVNRFSCSIMALSNIGAFLSIDSIRQYYPNSYEYPNYTNFEIQIMPQIINPNVPITDTINWVRIQGVFKAKGGEKWMTIGHFKNQSEQLVFYDTFQRTTVPYSYSYYFLDDVSVYVKKSVIYPDSVCKGELVELSSNFVGPFKWFRNGVVFSTDSIYRTHIYDTETFVLESSNGRDTFAIQVNSSAFFNLMNDTFICNGDSLKITIPGPESSVIWSDFYTGNNRMISTNGTFSVTRNIGKCKYTDTITIVARPKPSNISISAKENCSIDSQFWSVKLGENYKYLWLMDLDTNRVKHIESEGTFPIRVTSTNSCEIDTNIIIGSLCIPQIWIPNAFVPLGVNKTFKPITTNVKWIEMKIYNRWGEEVFMDTNESVEWNGVYQKELCPDGIYVYVIRYTGFNGHEYYAKGIISLIN